MSNHSSHSIKILLFILVGLVLASPVFAFQLDYPDWFLKGTRERVEAGEEIKFGEFALGIFQIFLIAAGAAAFMMITVGGVRYLVSAGNPSQTGDARNQVFSAILGLALLLGSYLVLNTINPELVALKEPGELPKLGEVVLPTTGKITVLVEQPKEEKKEFDVGSHTKNIGLQGSLKLFINTDNNPVEAWLEAEKKAGGAWRPWTENLKIKPENTTTVDEIITVPADVKGFDVETPVPVKFIISVGKALTGSKIVLRWEITSPVGNPEGQEAVDISITQQWTKTLLSYSSFDLVSLAVDPPVTAPPKLKTKGYLVIGICPLCLKLDKTVELELNVTEMNLFDESYKFDVFGLGVITVGAKAWIKWIQQ